MIDRRTFTVSLALGVIASTLVAYAQPARKVYKIGILVGGIPPDGFREGLRELGYVEGQNVVIIERSAEGRNERFPDLVAELLRLGPDAIVSSATPGIHAAKVATKTVPIVMAGLTDPIGAGIVPNLARPAKNATTTIPIVMVMGGDPVASGLAASLSRWPGHWGCAFESWRFTIPTSSRKPLPRSTASARGRSWWGRTSCSINTADVSWSWRPRVGCQPCTRFGST